MQVVNVHCTNYDSEDFAFPPIPPNKKGKSKEIDLRGTKIFVAWVKSSTGSKVCVEYLSLDKSEVVQTSDWFDLSEGQYRRLQFGTYNPTLQLPAMYIRLVVENCTGPGDAIVRVDAEAQIQ